MKEAATCSYGDYCLQMWSVWCEEVSDIYDSSAHWRHNVLCLRRKKNDTWLKNSTKQWNTQNVDSHVGRKLYISSFAPTYSDGMHGVAQTKLPANHHGFLCCPACAAHCAPLGPNLNLHPALITAPTAHYPDLQKYPAGSQWGGFAGGVHTSCPVSEPPELNLTEALRPPAAEKVLCEAAVWLVF